MMSLVAPVHWTHPFRRLRPASLAILLFCLAGAPLHALTPADWRQSQTLLISATGLIRVNLPPVTLDAAQPGFQDLRILDSAGNEIPSLVDRSAPPSESDLPAKDFHSRVEGRTTILTFQTGTILPIRAVTIEAPANTFSKTLRVEGSADGVTWAELAAGQPIFRELGAENLRVSLSEGVWTALRITVDDQHENAITFTGAKLRTAGQAAPVEMLPVAIKSLDEQPSVTRLSLELPARNLSLASLHFVTTDRAFKRTVALDVPEIVGNQIQEQPLSQNTIYRLLVNGKTQERLELPIERQIRGRKVAIQIHNQENPPIIIDAIQCASRPVRLLFLARTTGTYTLLSGNRRSAAPAYDLSPLNAALKSETAAEVQPSLPIQTPGYKPPERMADYPLIDADADWSLWSFRKAVQLLHPGVQQLDADFEVLAHCQPNGRDLRLLSGGREIPYLVDRPTLFGRLSVNGSRRDDPKKPAFSRWAIQLPIVGLPLMRLGGYSATPLFQRDMRLWEELADDRGELYPNELGHITWKQAPVRKYAELGVPLTSYPLGDLLFLETDNGANPPIELHDFCCYYSLIRLVFMAAPDPAKPIWLYYGNKQAGEPHYNAAGIAEPALNDARGLASLGREEPLAPAIVPASVKRSPPASSWPYWTGGIAALLLLGLSAAILRKRGDRE